MEVKAKKEKWTPPFAVVEQKLRAIVKAAKPGESLDSEVTIARKNGVSRMTARKAVNVLVSEGLVERRAGVGLFVRNADTLTRCFRFIAGNLLWDAAMKVASAVRDEARAHGAEIELRDAGGDLAAFIREIKALPKSRVAGAIVFASHDAASDAAIRKVAESGFPISVVDRVPRGDAVSSVVSDNVGGGKVAADLLVDGGRDSLAFIGDLVSDTVAERWVGFKARCLERGLSEPVCYDITGVDRFGSWESAVKDIVGKALARKQRPTGIFCSCDAVARFALRALAGHGFAVPSDMAIVGFDNDPIAEWTTPALTTVAQDFAELGRTGVRNLIAVLADPAHAPRCEVVPVKLVRRESAV